MSRGEMPSSTSCVNVISMAVLLQFVLVSASPKSIDAICQHVTNKSFCIKALTDYPPAASATTTFHAAKAAIDLAKSYAEKCMKFTEKAAKKNPKLKKQFMDCQDAYDSIKMSLKSAAGELNISPETSNYDAMVCTDHTRWVKELVGKNRDETSKTIMKKTLMMNKLIAIAVGATEAVPQGEP